MKAMDQRNETEISVPVSVMHEGPW